MAASVGEQLAHAREELQLSLKDVSESTKIQPWVLEALEADRLQTIMSPIYVKGFLSTYAKFLRLDSDPLIAQLFPEPQLAASEPPIAPAPEMIPWSLELAWPVIRRIAAVTVGLAGIVALIIANPLRWISTKAPRQEASLSVATPKSFPSETLLSMQPTQPLELAILTRWPTWVSVKADGRLIAQHQLAAGSQETWKARRRFELIIAKPSQVEVLLNGQSISPQALAHHGRLSITHQSIRPLSDSSP